MEVPYNELVEGEVYLVSFSDCCVRGALKLTFQKMLDSSENMEEFQTDRGVLENRASSSITFEQFCEIDEQSDIFGDMNVN